MKIKPEHLQALVDAIKPLDTPERRAHYTSNVKAKDINKRYRWDLLYISKLKIGDGRGCEGLPLYEYMNDVHIDTALRSIVPLL